jgi:phosphoglycolate phosphatase-like HAD superfamily hydrolase
MTRHPIALVITDLDNTLYDWVSAFVPAFYEMVREAALLMGIERERLLDDLQAVHRLHGDSEHPFALLETVAVQNRFAGVSRSELAEILDPAFHAFNRVRKHKLKLYEGVHDTLDHLSGLKLPVVAYTDARVINCVFRLERLGIKHFIARLYAPAHVTKEVGLVAGEDFACLLPPSDRKPNPQTLLDICSRYSVAPSDALYVGDSLVRDIYMAKRAGLHSAWASYGTLYDKDLWQQMVRVTHWTDADVEQEKMLREEARGVEPDCVLERFSDLTRYFEFAKATSATSEEGVKRYSEPQVSTTDALQRFFEAVGLSQPLDLLLICRRERRPYPVPFGVD